MADARTILLPLLIIALVLFTPDTSLHARIGDNKPTLDDAIVEARRLLSVFVNSTHTDLDRLVSEESEDGTRAGLNVTGFESSRNYSWNALPVVKERARENLDYALGGWGLQTLRGEKPDGQSPQIYRNATGFARGRWVRSKIQQQIVIPQLNTSTHKPIGSTRSQSAHTFDRNFTGDAGDMRFDVRMIDSANDLPSHEWMLDRVTHMSMELTLTEDRTEQEAELLLQGVAFPHAGLGILSTTSSKFAGLFALPLLTLSDSTFNESRTLITEHITKSIAKRDERALNPITTWLAEDEQSPQRQAPPSKCELIIYLQQLPAINSAPPKVPFASLDHELRFPTGISSPSVPDLQFSMIIYSPDCGYVLESQGPPDFSPQQSNHLNGPKSEVIRDRARRHLLLYLAIVVSQLVSLLRQIRDANTSSTRSRISFYTIATMVFGDAFVTIAFIMISLIADSIWVTTLSTAFFSLTGTMLFGMRFLMDIWSVHAPERQRREREAIEERRRRREAALLSARALAQARYAADHATASGDNVNASTVHPPMALPDPVNAPESLPLPVTAARTIDFGSLPVFMPSDQAGLQQNDALAESEAEARVPTFGSIYLRFSFLLLMTLFLTLTAITFPRTLRRAYFTMLALTYLSFWLPQINRNVQRNCRRALNWEYVLSQSALRLLPIAYFFGWDGNILFIRAHRSSMVAMAAWLWIQVVVLASQEIVGPRWFVKKEWVPPAYDYHPILRSDLEGSTLPLGMSDAVSLPSSPSVGRRDSIPNTAHKASVAKESKGRGKRVFDCAICMQDLEVPVVEAGDENESITAMSGTLMLARRTYMVTPCRHIFHSNCLEGWMKYRLQCPICREALPPL